jgi:F-type H+-transporting ATPase subunit b
MVIAEESSGGVSALGINTWFFVSQLISFLVVLVILWKWGFPMIQKTMEKRQQIIREGLENAERAKRDLQEAQARADQVLQDARRQAQETIEKAARDAQQQANRIIEDAQARAKQVEQQQLARIQQESNRALADINRYVVNLSIEAASKVIGKSVDSKDNRRLIEDFVVAADKTRNN